MFLLLYSHLVYEQLFRCFPLQFVFVVVEYFRLAALGKHANKGRTQSVYGKSRSNLEG